MKYLKLYENFKNNLNIEKIKEIIKSNQFLSKYADDMTQENILESESFIYVKLPSELDSTHISKHFDKTSTGSIWSITKDEVSKLIIQTIENTEPTKFGQEGPTFKYKWLNIEANKNIGFDSLIESANDVEKTIDLEAFGMVDRVKDWNKIQSVAVQNRYELVAKQGDTTREYTEKDLEKGEPCFIKQEIGVVIGDKMKNPTRKFNIITAKVGELEKPVITLMTTFPGISPVDKDGKDILNKKDLLAAGYALIKSER